MAHRYRADSSAPRVTFWLLILAAAVVGAPAAADAGRMVELTTAYGTRFDAYATGPEDSARGAVLVHDRWGLNSPVRAWADRLSELGLRVLAVDLYDGRPVRPAALAWERWSEIDPVWVEANLDAAIAYLRRQGQQDSVVVAWGRGVGPARELVKRAPGAVTAMVIYLDDRTALRSDRDGGLPIRVLDISTPRSLVHPDRGGDFDRAARDAWDATRRFLSSSAR